jgi:uncharacterized protein YegP (UPF0339 family)
MNYRFKVYQDKDGEWRWTLWSNSDKIADSGEGYESRTHTLDMVNAIIDIEANEVTIEIE